MPRNAPRLGREIQCVVELVELRFELELFAPGFDCVAGEGVLEGCAFSIFALGWVFGTLAVGAGPGTVAVGAVGTFAGGGVAGAIAEG